MALAIEIDQYQPFISWFDRIIESHDQASRALVQRRIIGAFLERRFQNLSVPKPSADEDRRLTSQVADFELCKLAYHIVEDPSRNVIRNCSENIRVGSHPILLVPADRKIKAQILAEEAGINDQLTIMPIEAFIAFEITQFSLDENKEFLVIFNEIVQIYNRRLSEVEADLSLQIQVR